MSREYLKLLEDMDALDEFFGPPARSGGGMFRGWQVQYGQLAQELMNRLVREGVLPAEPPEPFIDWWHLYLEFDPKDAKILRYFYPHGPRYVKKPFST